MKNAACPISDVLEGTFSLSRFAYFRVVDETLVVASPRTHRQLPVASGAVLALLYALRKPVDLVALLEPYSEQTQERLMAVLEVLYEAHLLVRAEQVSQDEDDAACDGASGESGGPLRAWEFHDLLYHAQSRQGRAHQRLGGTYRFKEKAPPVPPVKQWPDVKRIALPRPDIDALAASDASFSEVMERRTSTRTFGEKSLTLAQLGEFLFRTCRVKSVVRRADGAYLTRRVYPSGGSMYPLEVYPLVGTCDGLEPGLYHYDAFKHNLAVLDVAAEARHQLQQAAQSSANLEEPPPVLFIISARFARTAYKYESIAYSLILKEVGVLYQTMWLTASAMKLAACGLGLGNSDVFAEAIGSDYYAETSVGEFVLGPMP